MAISQESYAQAQLLFVAYYGRPADPNGLEYWAGRIEADGVGHILNAFGTSEEYDARFGSLSNNQLINNLYNQLFGRDAEVAGLQYYSNLLTSGDKTLAEIAYEIAGGAQGDDATALQNKLAVANQFTASIDTAAEVLAYEGNDAADAARDFLATVDDTNPTADVDGFLDTLVNPPVAGETIVLTTGQDIVTGTAGDDDIRATQDTLQNGDDLDGGAGSDQLSLAVAQGSGAFFTAPNLSNIEKIQVNGPNLLGSDSITFDLSNSDGYNTLESFQTTQGGLPSATQNQMATLATATVTFRDIQNVNGTDIRIIDTNLNHLYTYDTNAYESLFGGNDDVVDIYLQQVDGSTITLENVTSVQNTPGGGQRSHVDRVNITSDERAQVNVTPDNYVWELNVGPVFEELFIDGNANLEIEKFLDESVKLVDATELNADLALDLLAQGNRFSTNGDPLDLLTVKGAQGDDSIDVRGVGQDRGANGDYNLGTGDDLLRVGNSSDEAYFAEHTTGHNVVDSGPGDNTVVLNATGLQDVTTGEGDDTIYINGDVDDLRTSVYGDGVSTINTGAGDDFVYINGQVNDGQTDYASANRGQGDYEIDLGEGDDYLEMHVDGNQTIAAGEGNDIVWIEGNGVHDIDLGNGDNYLLIQGSRVEDNNVDNTIEDLQTKIVAGDGDDIVVINGDHYLNVDLGAGDDQIVLLANELTVDDVIDGGEGRDTLSLRNLTNGIVTTGISETSSVTSIEVFDLWDTRQVLKLSSDNFDTAEDNHITVKTTNSRSDDLAVLTINGQVAVEFEQGMSRAEYNEIRTNWANGVYDQYAGGPVTLEDWLIGQSPIFNPNAVDAVDFADGDTSGDSNLYDEAADPYLASDIPANDVVNFRSEPGTQTVDITGVPLSVVSGRGFKLEGGNVRDIVVVDDAALSSRLELAFDSDKGTAESIHDTLRVIDAATITAADLRNVSGLEIIELQASLNSAQTWDIQLNDRVINQTTGSADFVIRIDPEVAAGSRVYIELDPSVADANKNVRIEKVANVDVYINGNLVTEPEFGDDFNAGNANYSITVNPALLFTTNADSLVGTDGNDIFVAASVDQVQAADSVDGGLGRDTVQLNFAVSNATDSMMDQLNNPQLTSIEEITFETGNNVQMSGLGAVPGSLDTVTTGYGDDTLTNMAKGYTYNLRGGENTVNTISLALGAAATNINGSVGYDVVNGTNGTALLGLSDVLNVTDVDEVNLFNGNDVVTVSQNVDDGDITVNGGAGAFLNPSSDTVNINGPIGGTVFANNVELINDSGFGNTIVADGRGNDSVTVNGAGGADNITVFNTDDAVVNAGNGNDIVEVYDVDTATVNGGQGDDDIHVRDADVVTVSGGQGDDTILVENVNTATVSGGQGDDDITVLTVGGETSIITGGSGDDTITLSGSINGGQDTIVFGDIQYNALQQQTVNTQGVDTITNFNFEAGGPGFEDVLDFTAFLGGAGLVRTFVNAQGSVNLGNGNGDNVAAIELDRPLEASDISVNNGDGLIWATDNARAVVITGRDTDGIPGMDQFDVYFVQDVDQDTGQAWFVDHVATIDSITNIGVIDSIDAVNIA